jgi:methylated-DNA-[protein]-cysteine S-methyltransferase
MSETLYLCSWKSPFGELKLAATKEKLVMCDWQFRRMRSSIDQRIVSQFPTIVEGRNEMIDQTILQLEEYEQGLRQSFDIPIGLIGTNFQKTVWNTLLNIPYGKTYSYTQLSILLNNKEAIRAVASANGANAISIIIPCHRIIGSDGDLVGYAGGLSIKKRLLQLEGSYSQLSLFE